MQMITSVSQPIYIYKNLFKKMLNLYKLFKLVLFFKNLHFSLPRSLIGRVAAYITPKKKTKYSNLAQIGKELCAFRLPGEVDEKKVDQFITNFNHCFPNNTIKKGENILAQIQTRKLQLIQQGEKVYLRILQPIGLYAPFYFLSESSVASKIAIYRNSRSQMAGDWDYQQKMIDYANHWYTTADVIELPPCPA